MAETDVTTKPLRRHGAEYSLRIYRLLMQIFKDAGFGSYGLAVETLVEQYINSLSAEQVRKLVAAYDRAGVDITDAIDPEPVNEVEKTRGVQFVSKAVAAALLFIAAGATIKDYRRWARNKAKVNGFTLANQYVARLNTYVHQAAGYSEGYEWVTQGDDRVRDDHEKNNGKFYEWGEVTDTPSGGPPGTEINCRCHQRVRINRARGARP